MYNLAMEQAILVLGCGVSGLSSGILLLKAGFEVTIWAKDLPPNTTSNKAGAFWYPYLCNPKDKAIKWSKYTLDYFLKEFLNDPSSGCAMRTMTEVFDIAVGDPWWKDAVPAYRRLPKEKLPQGYADSYQLDLVLMDTSIYMNFLLTQFKQLGGIVVQKQVKDIKETFMHSHIAVNCTGLGSRELFNDKLVFPVRGQIVKVKPNGFNKVIADDSGHNNLAYIIPRINDVVLGGTAQKDNWNTDVDPKDTQDILRKCALLEPRFKQVEIIGESVGLRPARSEVRLEIEKFGDHFVIHNYGHGGAGFTLSWGCADEVVTHVKKLTT